MNWMNGRKKIIGTDVRDVVSRIRILGKGEVVLSVNRKTKSLEIQFLSLQRVGERETDLFGAW